MRFMSLLASEMLSYTSIIRLYNVISSFYHILILGLKLANSFDLIRYCSPPMPKYKKSGESYPALLSIFTLFFYRDLSAALNYMERSFVRPDGLPD